MTHIINHLLPAVIVGVIWSIGVMLLYLLYNDDEYNSALRYGVTLSVIVTNCLALAMLVYYFFGL